MSTKKNNGIAYLKHFIGQTSQSAEVTLKLGRELKEGVLERSSHNSAVIPSRPNNIQGYFFRENGVTHKGNKGIYHVPAKRITDMRNNSFECEVVPMFQDEEVIYSPEKYNALIRKR